MRRFIPLAVLAGLAACSMASPDGARGPVPSLQPAAVSPERTLEGSIWHVDSATRIEPETLAARLAAADYAILGEVHDNPAHHERQAWLTGRIAPAGLAFEMIPEASEEGIAVFLAQGGAREAIGDAIGWDRLGWPDWGMYAPIMAAAPEAYVAGGGVPRSELAAAMQSDAAAVFGAGAGRYGLAGAMPAELRAEMAREMVASHCNKLPEEMAARMVEAQRLRDARFARALRRAAREGGGRAVLITGNGHARTDRGVPVALAAAEPDATIRALGQIETRPGAVDLADYAGTQGLPYDYVWFSAPVDRDDPCAVFDAD